MIISFLHSTRHFILDFEQVMPPKNKEAAPGKLLKGSANVIRALTKRNAQFSGRNKHGRRRVFGNARPMRIDEQHLYQGLETRKQLKQSVGVRMSSDVTSHAVCVVGCCKRIKDAKLATGPKEKSAVRAQLAVVDCLAEAGGALVKRVLEALGELKMSKRSQDESPFHVRDSDGCIVPAEVLNRRLHLRWGDAGHCQESRVALLGGELEDADALGMLECLGRVLPSFHLEALQSHAAKCKLLLLFHLGDGLRANG